MANIDNGGREFYELSKRLKEVGGTGTGSLRNEMQKAVKKAARPAAKAAKEEAGVVFPRRGGLNEIMRRRQVAVRTATGVHTAGVRIVAPKIDRRIEEQGMIRHPVFGDDETWVAQYVPAAKGYFTRLMQRQAPQIRGDVADIMEEYVRYISRPL